MIPQFIELISKYKPTVIFIDGEWWNSAEQWNARELISWYYNEVGEDAIVNDRWDEGADYGLKTPEYSAGITMTDRSWAEIRGIGRSFGYNRNEPLSNYLTEQDLIHHFVTLVVNGCGLTLNIGLQATEEYLCCNKNAYNKWRMAQSKWRNYIQHTRLYKTHTEEKPVSVTRVDSTINFSMKTGK